MIESRNLKWGVSALVIVAGVVVIVAQPWKLSPAAQALSDQCDAWVQLVDEMKEGRADPLKVEEVRLALEAAAKKDRDAWGEALDYRKKKHYIVPATLDR